MTHFSLQIIFFRYEFSNKIFLSNLVISLLQKKPGEKGSENHERREPHTETSEKKDNVKHKSPDKPKVETKVETDKVKRPPPNLENRQNKSENANKRTLEPRENKTVTSESPGQSSKPVNSRQKENNNEVKVSKENNSAQNDFSKSEATMKNEETNVSLKKEKVEAETLARLQAAAENVVLSAMTAEVQIGYFSFLQSCFPYTE